MTDAHAGELRRAKEAELSVRDILAELVSFPTVSRSSNASLIDYATGLLETAGFEVDHVEAGDGRRNLFATLGPPDRYGVILSGHTDVVPVEGQSWRSDPYTLVERDGRLYGRGTADMKGFVACALDAAVRAREHDLKLPIHIALSCDEEIGCVGVRPLLERLREQGRGASFCLVGEPTSMRVATCHKGKIAARAICSGREAHSALATQGINAIHMASEFVFALRALQHELAEQTSLEDLFELPYSTIHVGTVSGGVTLNIVPKRCVIEFEIRNMPDTPAEAILDRIRAEAEAIAGRYHDPNATIEIEVAGGYPGLLTSDDTIGEAVSLTDANTRIGLSFGTEAGLYHKALGVPTLVCGPGSMDQGHQADEFVEIEQLRRCGAMLQRIFRRLAIDSPLPAPSPQSTAGNRS